MNARSLRGVVVGVLLVATILTVGQGIVQAETDSRNVTALASDVRQLEATSKNSIGLIGGGFSLGAGAGVLLGAVGSYVYWNRKL